MPRHPVADWAAARRAKLAEAFPDDRLVLPAGTYKVRANDTDYRFRPDTAHTYFSGNQTSDAVLVVEDGESVLYARPRSERDTDEFFRDRQYGELWAGRRPSAQEISDSLGIEVRHVKDLPSLRPDKTATPVSPVTARPPTSDLARVADELRLIKDEWEVARAPGGLRHHHPRLRGLGPRVGARARVRRAVDRGHLLPAGPRDGQRHRLRLHRAAAARTPRRCTGSTTPAPIEPGKLVLLDMGVEGHNLYTADVTRTLPVDGRFTPLQRELYDLVQPRSRPASTPSAPAHRSSPRTTPR